MSIQQPLFSDSSEASSEIPKVTNGHTEVADTLYTTWKEALTAERSKPYFRDLIEFIEGERVAGKTIYPPKEDTFNALALTPLSEVKVVILGQDPYHGPEQAHGLSFSVKPGVPAPPSLMNILKELSDDLNVPLPKSGSLEKWARQGVLLLNNVLTVERGNAHSHAKKGWEQFTDKVIQTVNLSRPHVAFILWGSPAQKKAAEVDTTKHLIVRSPHPSPLSAHRGFFGSHPFSKANSFLREHQIEEIDWSLNEERSNHRHVDT